MAKALHSQVEAVRIPSIAFHVMMSSNLLHLITRQNPRSRFHLLVQNSLKQEDKGPRDERRSKKKKNKTRRKRRRWRPEEINPFKEPISQYTPPVSPINETDEIEGFDMDRILGTSDLEEMFRKLDEMEDDEESVFESEKDAERVLDGDISEFLEPSDDILDFKDSKESSDEEDLNKFLEDFSFDENDPEGFFKLIKNVDPDEFFETHKDLVKEVREKLQERRSKGLIPPDECEIKWANSFDQFCWDFVQLLFPRRGKRDHHQNWDHINVSEEIKEKRVRKKSKGYSIWLSMEISKSLKISLRRLNSRPLSTKKQLQILEPCLKRFSALLRFQEMKFDLRNLTSMLHSIALLTERDELRFWILQNHAKLIFSLFAKIEDQMSEMTARSVIEVIWSCQKFGPELSIKSSDIFPLELTTFRTFNYTNFLNSLFDQAGAKDMSYNTKDLVICLSSLLSMDWIKIEQELMDKFLEQVIGRVDCFNHRDITMMLDSCVQSGRVLPNELIERMVQKAIESAPDFSPQGLAMTVHSLARLDHFNASRMLELFLGEMERQIARFKPQELAIMMWGCARLRHLPPRSILHLVANTSVQKMDEFSLQGASNLIWAFAVFGYVHDGLIQAVKARIVFHERSEIKAQDLSNTLWSLAILNGLDLAFLEHCLKLLASKIDLTLHPAVKLQIFQCWIHINVYFPNSQCFDVLPPDFLEDCKLEWKLSQTRSKPDPFLEEVVEFLQKSDYETQFRHGIYGGLFQVMTVTKNEVDFVLESWNDEIQFKNVRNRVIGRRRWREKLLTRLGYFILRLQPTQWTDLHTQEQKLNFIKGKL